MIRKALCLCSLSHQLLPWLVFLVTNVGYVNHPRASCPYPVDVTLPLDTFRYDSLPRSPALPANPEVRIYCRRSSGSILPPPREGNPHNYTTRTNLNGKEYRYTHSRSESNGTYGTGTTGKGSPRNPSNSRCGMTHYFCGALGQKNGIHLRPIT